MNDVVDEKEFNEQWEEMAKIARERLENVLSEAKRMWLKKDKKNTKKKELPIIPIQILFSDAELGLPIYAMQIECYGTHQELAQLLENRMPIHLKKVFQSLSYKKSIYKMYVDMIDNYKMKPTEIYPLLHADYDNLSAKDKRKFQNNLRTNYTRLTRAKKPEK